jgi:hypothetical protein
MDGRFIHHRNAVSSPHCSAPHDDSHNARFSHKPAVSRSFQNGGEQAGPKGLDLRAWVAQTRNFYNRVATEEQFGPRGQRQKIHASSRYVFSQVPWRYLEPDISKLRKELLVQQMHLAQVRLAWIFGYARPVFDRGTEVSIAADSAPLYELDALLLLLGETMLWRCVNGSNPKVPGSKFGGRDPCVVHLDPGGANGNAPNFPVQR